MEGTKIECDGGGELEVIKSHDGAINLIAWVQEDMVGRDQGGVSVELRIEGDQVIKLVNALDG